MYVAILIVVLLARLKTIKDFATAKGYKSMTSAIPVRRFLNFLPSTVNTLHHIRQQIHVLRLYKISDQPRRLFFVLNLFNPCIHNLAK